MGFVGEAFEKQVEIVAGELPLKGGGGLFVASFEGTEVIRRACPASTGGGPDQLVGHW